MNPASSNGIYPFYIDLMFSETDDLAFEVYWDEKGVYTDRQDDGSWQYEMLQILQGIEPIFFLRVQDGSYMLIDGLQFLYYYHSTGCAPSDVPLTPLRLGGDYPSGLYYFVSKYDYKINLDWQPGDSNDLYNYHVNLAVNNPNSAVSQAQNYAVSLEYWTSDPSARSDVAYKKGTYRLTLDDNPSTFYYLDVSAISPIPVNGFYSFSLEPPTDPAFWDYWAAKGVAPGMTNDGSWQYIMLEIITGNAPMFILRVQNGDYMLVDGLQFIMAIEQGGLDPNNLPLEPPRLNGDYPAGTYTFVGATGIPLSFNTQLLLPGFDGYNFTMQIS